MSARMRERARVRRVCESARSERSTYLLRSSLIGLISILRRPMAREDGAVEVVQRKGGEVRGRETTGLSQRARAFWPRGNGRADSGSSRQGGVRQRRRRWYVVCDMSWWWCERVESRDCARRPQLMDGTGDETKRVAGCCRQGDNERRSRRVVQKIRRAGMISFEVLVDYRL